MLTAPEEDVFSEDLDEVVTLALFAVAELSLPPFLAPQPATTATASAIGIAAFNRFFALIAPLTRMRFLQTNTLLLHLC